GGIRAGSGRLTTPRGGCFRHLGLPRIAFANARCLAAQIPQVVKLGAAYVAFLHHVDMIDDSRVEWKDSFDTNPEAGFAHGNGLSHAAMLTRDYHAFKSLQAFLGL